VSGSVIEINTQFSGGYIDGISYMPTMPAIRSVLIDDIDLPPDSITKSDILVIMVVSLKNN
jgi:hypothetical protein